MQTERPLGLLEKYQVSKQLLRCYGCVTTTAVFRHSPRPDNNNIKQFYLNQLHAPLTQLVEKHPQLSLVVSQSDESNAHFLRLNSFNLESIVTIKHFPFYDQNELSQLIGTESDREFDLNDHTIPPWHLTIGVDKERPDECSMTLAAHHVIMDGKSFAQFWQDLKLGQQQGTQPDTYTIQGSKKELLGSYENRGAPMPTAMDLVPLVGKSLAKKILPKKWAQDWLMATGCWAGDRPADQKETHDTKVRAMTVGGTAWRQICATCREHNVTPHAAIMAALVEAFTKVYPNTAVKTTTPVNCRSFAHVPPDEMGNFVGSFGYTWNSNDMAFWDRAKTYHRLLRASKGEAAKEAGLLKYLNKYPDDYFKFWQDNWDYPMARSGGIELSDLGRVAVNSSSSDGWALQSLYFCQSAQTFTTALGVNSISTEDSMYATIGWQKNSVDEDKAEALCALLQETLYRLI